MNTKLILVAAGLFLAALGTGFGQPVITQQPQSCTNVVGTTATFTVAATGTAPLAYQWQKSTGTWTDLADCANAAMVLTNVQTSHAGAYRVVVTNSEGAVTGQVAQLTVVASPPRINPTTSFQHQAVHLGSNASFTVSVSGTALSYQWRLNGHELSGQTSNKLSFNVVQPADEGDYSVVVTNMAGAVTSEPARLWVVPLASGFIKRNFTNNSGLRLPYFYLLPENYDAARAYPLVCLLHGSPADETVITNANYGYTGLADTAAVKVFASYRQQAADPVILLWPTRRAGDFSWTSGPSGYLQQVSDLLDQFSREFDIDTNRVYLTGFSEGVHAAWDLMGMRHGFFAGAALAAGWLGSTPAAANKNMPTWVWCAQNDDAGQLPNTRSLVNALRLVGGNPIYTEYTSGGHIGGILMGLLTPASVDWLLVQRRGVASTAEPILSITSPTSEPTYASGVVTLSLAGSAEALGQDISRVTWENTTGGTGVASGTDLWSVTGVPLVPPGTNLIIVTATTTSWAPGYGGNTTFSDTLTVSWQFDRPLITAQPTDQGVRAGTTASLTVAAYGPLPMSYQWQFNAAPINGATNATLTLTNVQATQAGPYAVVVTNPSGSVTSAPATLTILFDPIFVQQPCSVAVPQGGSVTLSVAVTNNATLPIGYRWRRGTSTAAHALVNEHVNFLTLTNCQTTTNYEVIVTNLTGRVLRSTNVLVTVLPDADGDGLPDAWEIDCGLCQTNLNHGLADDDADGRSNLQEYQAGTDPTNALSFLQVEGIDRADGGSAVVLCFVAVSNRTYTVRYREALNTGEWTRLADVAAAHTNRMVELRDPTVPNGPQRFYRLLTPGNPSP